MTNPSKPSSLWGTLAIATAATLSIGSVVAMAMKPVPPTSLDTLIQSTFAQQHIQLTSAQAKQIRPHVEIAIKQACQNPRGNSKVGFEAVEIADELEMNPQMDRSLVDRIKTAIEDMATSRQCQALNTPDDRPQVVDADWEDYFKKTISLNSDPSFLSLVQEKQFYPVKISWEDIGRYENSVWGDRISDVGIWVRQTESDPDSAKLALSVRRDSNFRDKILIVPSDKIKVHVKQGSRTQEVTLPERLKQLGLNSGTKDKHVIVSNQFAVVPVPAKTMRGNWSSASPRAAFNFSIYPYGSKNFVITDVIEGSSNAIVGPGNHQLLYANINGQKAPFTASRAEDRPDLLRLEKELKAQGMDVDVQRYYLIQVPLKKEAQGIELSNMGTPPMRQGYYYPAEAEAQYDMAAPTSAGVGSVGSLKKATANEAMQSKAKRERGLTKVAIGHGDAEGPYKTGSGYRGQRAEEPVRVTVVYFVTPVGDVSQSDMEAFTKAFEAWDNQALWGGSFVVKDDVAAN